MFIYDRPIENESADSLGRKGFSQHLGNALLDWDKEESLVIAINGKYGTGKSSVINMAKKHIEKSDQQNKPTIIEFNPWAVSEEDNLTEHFFNRIAEELEIKEETNKDKKLAEKLRFYASAFDLLPEESVINTFYSKALISLGMLGVSLNQVITWLKISAVWNNFITFIFGVLLLLAGTSRRYLIKIANFFDKKADFYSKSIFEIKKEIKLELSSRKKKLVIIIDDIDRLTKIEIRKIFRIIRINADFPNTVYLLAFDREVIEQGLEEQAGVSGKDYLSKIIQVTFDLPFANPSKVAAALFAELDNILGLLPKSASTIFEKNINYWANTYSSGFKDFFKNIRDVKRFANSLKFNIRQMHQGDIMEVNPIDFIAIEAIRVFAPGFYEFMRSENSLFADIDASRNSGTNEKVKKERKDKIDTNLNKLDENTKLSVRKLIFKLFPQVSSVFNEYGNIYYGHEDQLVWTQELRVCSKVNFDSYFTLIPGGDENELSQYEIDNILNTTYSEEEFQEVIQNYLNDGKIRKVLSRIQDFTNNQERIPQGNIAIIIKVLFNISDDLPDEKAGMFDFGANIDLMRIIYQLLKRKDDKNENFQLLATAIKESKGISGPIQRVSFESSDRSENVKDSLVPKDKIEFLQKLCIEKLRAADIDNLLKNRDLIYILYRWKEWDKEQGWQDFIRLIIADDERVFLFLDKFIIENISQTLGEYGVKIIKKFHYENLKDFISPSELDKKLREIQKNNPSLYADNKKNSDLFLKKFNDEKSSK